MTASLLVLLKLLVSVMVLAIGMGSTVSDLTYLWRHPKLLLRSVVAMYVLVPLLALFLMAVLSVPIEVEVALLVIAISAGAPLLPRKLMGLDNDAYVFSLMVTSSILAVVTVPAWLALLSTAFDSAAAPEAMDVARLIFTSLFAPLLVGMVLRWLLPFVDDRLSDWTLRIAGLIMTLAGLVVVVTHWRVLAAAGWPFLGTLALMTFGALAIGHLTGGPDPDDRTALAVACATRHLGIAVLVAASLPGPRTAVLVIAYVVVSALVSIPYLQRRKRVAAAPADPSG
jgi:BASS family bile acid:Na+ symporter